MDYRSLFQPFDETTVGNLSSIASAHGIFSLKPSQRAMIANEICALSRREGKPLTRSKAAKIFEVSRQLIEEAGFVSRVTSQSVKEMILDGLLPLGRAVTSIKEAANMAGVKIARKPTGPDKDAIEVFLPSILANAEALRDQWTFSQNLRSIEAGLFAMERIMPTVANTMILRLTPEQKIELFSRLDDIIETTETIQKTATTIREKINQ